MGNYNVPNKTQQGVWTYLEHNLLKEAVNSKIDKNSANIATSMAGFQRVGDVVYDLIDKFTGEYFSASKVSGISDSEVDNIIYFKVPSTGEIFKRNIVTYINIEIFGGKGDWNGTTGTDNSIPLQNAINFLASKRYVANATIYCPAGKYNFLSRVDTYPNVRVLGDAETYFIMHNVMPANQPPFRVLNPINGENNIGNRRILFDIIVFVGHPNYANGGNTPNYRNSTCIQHNIPHTSIRHCSFHGFYAPEEYKTDSYIISHPDCTFSFNFYGLYFNSNGSTNLGENISFENCVLGNNINGIFNIGAYIHLSNSSIDYSRIRQVAENASQTTFNNSGLLFTNCHLEADASDPYPFVNNGQMKFDNCNLWNGPQGSSKMFLNNADLSFHNMNFTITGNNDYLVDGKPPTISGCNTFAIDAAINMIHPDLSKVYNSDFTNGTAGWFTRFDTAISTIASTRVAGNCLKVIGGGTYFSGEVESELMILDKSYSRIFPSFWVNTANAGAITFASFVLYDKYNNMVGDFPITTGDGSGWVFRFHSWLSIPKEAMYFQFILRSNLTAANFVLYDDIYVTYK